MYSFGYLGFGYLVLHKEIMLTTYEPTKLSSHNCLIHNKLTAIVGICKTFLELKNVIEFIILQNQCVELANFPYY